MSTCSNTWGSSANVDANVMSANITILVLNSEQKEVLQPLANGDINVLISAAEKIEPDVGNLSEEHKTLLASEFDTVSTKWKKKWQLF